MEIYVILALSLGLMFYIRYIREAIIATENIAYILDLKEKIRFNSVTKTLVAIVGIVFSTVFAPFVLINVIFFPRKDIVKTITEQYLKRFYYVEK